MRFEHVCVEACATLLPPQVVTSEELETRLAPLYTRLGLHVGRLELMTGIRERRHYDPGTRPGAISAKTARLALEQSGLRAEQIGALIHGSVCRDQMEPATAASVHQRLGLPPRAVMYDVSNACLGLLNGLLILAEMIESGRILAGVVVGTEIGRPLVDGTIDRLNRDPAVTRQSLKYEFASLTIGSGSAAIVACHRSVSKSGRRLLGGAWLTDTSQHELCAGGIEDAGAVADSRPRMSTDSEALLHAGVALAERTWAEARAELDWTNASVDKFVTHQVGKAHRMLLLDRLGLPADNDFPTVEFLGNTGAVALPTALALGLDGGHIQSHNRIALLGIGSGLSSIMLGLGSD